MAEDDDQNLVIMEALKDSGIAQSASDAQLNALHISTKRLFQLSARFERIDTEQKERSAEIQKLTTQIIPDIMIEAKMLDFTFENGAKISRGSVYLPSVAKENEAAVFEWMESQNHHGVIKSDVVIPFGKGGRVQGKRFIELLAILFDKDTRDEEILNSIVPEIQNLIDLAGIHLQEEIHWATMRAFVKEQVEAHEAKGKEAKEQTPPEELLPEQLKWIKQHRVKIDTTKMKTKSED